MIGWLFDLIFGCGHADYSFPQTRKKWQHVDGIHREPGTFVCCLECGREFEYDFELMRIVTPRERRRRAREVEA